MRFGGIAVLRNVHFWHKADIEDACVDVRYWGKT